jgi:alpha-beta hydrolase superfamily lysophospholipase/thiol-disulfide isomerase/thioredoxin
MKANICGTSLKRKKIHVALLAISWLVTVCQRPTLANVANDASPGTTALRSKAAKVLVRCGGDIPCTSWIQPDRPPFAAFLCLHGFGMNMNSYREFGGAMAALGIPTYAIDLRGFGSWQAAKGYNEVDFDDAISDVQEALRAVRRAHPHLPLVLIGESMGGALALQTMASDQALADAVICSVPADDRFGEKATDIKVALAMLKGVHHKIPIGTAIVHRITKNPNLREELEKDPHDRIDFSPKELIQFQKFMNRTDEEAKKVSELPVLFLQGGGDRLVKPKGTKDVYSHVASKDKDLILIGSSEHLILEEGQFDGHVISAVTSWVYRHVVLPKYPQGVFTAGNTGLPAEKFHQAMGHYRIGQGLAELGDLDGARAHLLQAIAVGQGTPIALLANQTLAGISKPFTVMSPETGTAAVDGLFVTHEEAMNNDKPTVIFFGARWIDPSYKLNEVIERAAAAYSSRVNFVRIDADDPKNQKLVEGYGVALVPSIVFLNGANKIVGTELGSLSDQTLVAEMPKILSPGEANIAINVPREIIAAKPSIIMLRSKENPKNRDVEIALNRLIEPYIGKIEFTELDAEDPKNKTLLDQYRDRPLPVVLFLNSTHGVVSSASSPVGEQDLAQGVESITVEKRLPLEANKN